MTRTQPGGANWARVLFISATLAGIPLSNSLRADEPASKQPAAGSQIENAPTPAPSDEVARLIKSLSAGNPLERREATKSLLELKHDAVDPVAKVAAEGRASTMYHCFDILAKLLALDDDATTKAAKSALDKLTESENKSVALRAKSVLRLHDILGRQAQGPQANALGGVLNLNVQVNGGAGMRVQTRVINGQRTIEVQNGDEKILIQDQNGKSIELKHTRKVDGKEKTDDYKGADLDELKKKHPEAAKLFEKYAAGNGIAGGMAGQIQIQAAQNGQPLNPQLFQPAQFNTATARSGMRTIHVDLADRRLEISDDDGQKIRIKVTKVIAGKETVEEFAAETAKALKSEHPEIAKLYEKYTGNKLE